MYDELVKRMWECASGECFNCSQYTPTTNASVCQKELMKQAADAIEELTGFVQEAERDRDEYRERLDKANDAIEELSKPRWIPVTERLPEDIDEEVLVCAEDYCVSGLEFVTVATYGANGWLECWERKTYLTAVTHWMPLPEPPKEEMK